MAQPGNQFLAAQVECATPPLHHVGQRDDQTQATLLHPFAGALQDAGQVGQLAARAIQTGTTLVQQVRQGQHQPFCPIIQPLPRPA